MNNKNEIRFIWLLLGIHAFAFACAIYFKGIYLKDSFEYLFQADNLMHYGSWYAAPWHAPVQMDFFSFRPPLYAMFIAICKLIWHSDYMVLIVQNILSIINLLLVNRIAKHFDLLNGKREWIIIVLVMLFPIQLIMANMVMSEILFQTLLLGLFHALIRFNFSNNLLNTLLISAFILLLLFTKPASLFIIVLVLALMAWNMFNKQTLGSNFKLFLLPLSAFIIGYGTISWQQLHQTGYAHYTSMKAFNQFKFNARFVLANKFGETYAEEWAEQSKIRINQTNTFKERYELMHHLGDSVLLKYPLTFAKLFVKGGVVFLLDPGRHDIAAFTNMSDDSFNGFFYELNNKGIGVLPQLIKTMPIALILLLLIILCWNFCQVLLLGYFLWNTKIPAWFKLVAIAIIAYMLLVTGILGVARYRSAVFPELCLMALFALHYLLAAKSAKA